MPHGAYFRVLAKHILGLFKAALLLLLLALICIATLLFATQRITNPAEYHAAREKWMSNGSTDYGITLVKSGVAFYFPEYPTHVESGMQLIVRDNQVVAINNIVCPECDVQAYEQFTIEALFREAEECAVRLFCRVSYDPVYGFPSVIFSGTIEGVGTAVEEFELLD